MSSESTAPLEASSDETPAAPFAASGEPSQGEAFPVEPAAPVHHESDWSGMDTVGSRPGARVLVIESDLEMADFLVALMENAGYKVEVAIDGHYGLMLADTFEPEVILLALKMPGMTGYEVTATLRNEPRFAQRFRFTRIYYICDKQQMLQRRFDALPGTPMSDYIFTPIDIPELLVKVARAVDESRGTI